jgi:hypothetical protein
MREFVNSNPGLESRFNRYIDFPDYTPEELRAIFDKLCGEGAYTLSKEASDAADRLFHAMHEDRDHTFANGRAVRNLFERAVAQQANRLAKETDPSKELLCAVEIGDLEKAAAQMQAERALEKAEDPEADAMLGVDGDDDDRGPDDGHGENSVEAAFR